MNTTEKILQVWDRQEIEQLMYRHARSLDRMDGELMKSTYWPEAIEELEDTITGQFQWSQKAWDFVPMAMQGFSAVTKTQHKITNLLIQLDGNTAGAESYVSSHQQYSDEKGTIKESIVDGRHVFKLEKRNSEWRILHRLSVFEFNTSFDSNAVWADEIGEKFVPKRSKEDVSYRFLK